MTENMSKAFLSFAAALSLTANAALAQPSQSAPSSTGKSNKAAAYYHYSMGHIYAELAEVYGPRGDYASKAINHYKEALKADPSAAFLTEELSDLYIRTGQIRTAVEEAEAMLRQDPENLSARRILGRLYSRMIGDAEQNRINERMLREAIDQYEKITAKEPSDLESWLMLGRLYKVAQNSPASEKAYKKALELDADNEDALTGLAMVYADLGDNKAASDLLRKVAEKNPNPRTLTSLAGLYEQMREFGLAAESLRRTLELVPGNIDVKKALAQNLLYSDQLDEALKLYQEIANEDPKDPLSFLRMSQIYAQRRKFDQAREAARKARELDPDNLEIRYNDVSLLEAEGKTQEAISVLQSILKETEKKEYTLGERSNRILLLERLGTLQRSTDQIDAAVETFRSIQALDSDLGPRVSAQIIETYRMGRKFAKAEQESEEAIRKYPDDRVIRSVRASALAEVGKAAQAVEELKRLLDGKNDREVYLSIAQIHERTKNYGEMAVALDAAEKLSKTKEEQEAVLFMRAAMYEKLKKFDQAEAEFRKILADNPKNASVLNYLGYMLADRNVRLQEAKELITKALEEDPNNGAYLDSLGWVYYRLGQLDQAEEYLRRSLEKITKDPVVHDHLGDVYAKQGNLKDAIAQWQLALQEYQAGSPNDHDPAEIAKIQKKLEGAKVRLAKEGGLQNKQR